LEPLRFVEGEIMHDTKVAEEIDLLYENFLHTGDLGHFYKCLILACDNDIIAKTAIDLIKMRFKDDADGRAAIIAANRHAVLDAEMKFQYDIWRSYGLSEGKIWRAFAEIYGGDPDSYKKRLKRKFKVDSKGVT